MRKLQPIVRAIEHYAQAVDVYSNAYPIVLSPLWGSIRVVLHVNPDSKKHSFYRLTT